MKKKIYLNQFLLVLSLMTVTGCTDDKHSKEPLPVYHQVYSDDSLVHVSWWDTGEGGTAPSIDAVCHFYTAQNEHIVEKRSLLTIVYPDSDYGHREVMRIVNLNDEQGQPFYIFFLRAKVGSNEYEHDIVALRVDGKELKPAPVFREAGRNVSHIELHYDHLFGYMTKGTGFSLG